MSSPQPLLYVIDHFKDPNAGTEGQLYQLIKHVDRCQFAPELLVFTDSEWLRSNDFPCPVTVLGCGSLSSIKTWWRLDRYAKGFWQRGGRLAHVYFNDASIICPPVFRIRGVKTLISRRDMGYWYTGLNRFVLHITRLFVSGVIANSQAVAEITSSSEGYSSENIKVIYNGYEGSYSPGDNQVLASLKKEGRLLVGLVANIRPIKRIEDAVRALGLLKDKAPLLDFIHIGEGDSTILRELAEDLNISERVHFLGQTERVKDSLQYFDVALLCSESEGFSNAIVEYLQQGVPVVCSDVGGNGEAITNDENGYLYSCGDIATLSARVMALVNDSELRESMSNRARHDSAARYNIEAMVNSHLEYYSDVIEGRL